VVVSDRASGKDAEASPGHGTGRLTSKEVKSDGGNDVAMGVGGHTQYRKGRA